MRSKPFWQSTTIRGAAIALLSSLYLILFGDDPSGSVMGGITDSVAKVLDVIGVLVAIYGRTQATTSLRATS